MMNSIKHVGFPTLHQPTLQVEHVDTVKDVIDELWDKVLEVKGLGLSANQIGYDVAVAVINNVEEGDQFTIINPSIIETYGDEVELREACLSIPGVAGNVKRHLSIKLSYMDEHGEQKQNYFVGHTAHIIQHEVEHLNGLMYIDNYGTIRRESMIKKFKKALKKAKG